MGIKAKKLGFRSRAVFKLEEILIKTKALEE
jgi:23S rRNA U2552 (ribose-2'-O)-methylase RlmE/FtsJ